MKNLIEQIWHWIMRYKKRLIYGVLALFIGQMCFFSVWWIENQVFAQSTDSQSQNDTFIKKATEDMETLSFVEDLIHILIYPMLVLAGKLVDNSFVYWEIFGFDTVLWQLWNITRNLANFTLWFLVVFKIFQNLVFGKWDNKWWVKSLLIKALVAWVWIQASWFVMGALVDISTIMAYGVWWLPISILNDDNQQTDKNLKYDPYILKDIIYFDTQGMTTIHYKTNAQKEGEWKYYISECETFKYKDDILILAPSRIYYTDNKWKFVGTEQKKCHYKWQIYYFTLLYNDIEREECNDQQSCSENQVAYSSSLNTAKNKISAMDSSGVVNLINNAQILEKWDSHSTGALMWKLWTKVYWENQWLDVDNKWTGKWNTFQLHDIMTWNSYVWVFTALYASLLSSWKELIDDDGWTFARLLQNAVDVCYLIAIAIPLIVLAAVLMARVWVIRVAIVLSPFIVLFTAFDDIQKKVLENVEMMKNFTVKRLISVIFVPAVVCFAVSLSTVLFSVIGKLDFTGIGWLERDILWWIITLDIWWISARVWELIISAFWIAITWFLVWTAVKTSKFKFVEKAEELAKNALWSIPIVPIPAKDGEWVNFIGANTAFGLNGNDWILEIANDKIKAKFQWESNDALEAFMDSDGAETKARKNRLAAYTDRLKTVALPSNGGWTQQEIKIWENNDKSITFADFNDSEKESLIDEINWMSETRRKEFGASQREIQMWNNETYIFQEEKDENWNTVSDKEKYKYVLKK